MKIKSFVISLFLILTAPLAAESIAVCIPAFEASESSIQALIESGRRHFCRLHQVDYFVLSDFPLEMEGDDIEWLASGGGKSFKLFQALQTHKKIFDLYSYLFIINPKMVFVAPVGNEVFGELIGVQKVNAAPQKPLFSAGFYGGRPSAVFELLRSGCRYVDSEQKINEEELINRCFKEKSPTRILSPSYAYPENWELEYSKKIVETRS